MRKLQGISLINVASKLLTGIFLRRLTNVREKQIRENQAGFRPGRGCIDHIFTLRQILEQRHTFRRPNILIFPRPKGCFRLSRKQHALVLSISERCTN